MMNFKGRLKLICSLFLFGLLFLVSATPIQQVPQPTGNVRDLAQFEAQIIKSYVDNLMSKGLVNDSSSIMEHLEHLFEKENTTTPIPESKETPFMCAVYSQADCESKGKCSVGVESCRPEKHLEKAGCFAVFSYPPSDDVEINSTEKFVPVHRKQIEKLGCLQFQDFELMGCTNDTVCFQGSKKQFGHCCCHTEMCNVQKWLQYNPTMNDTEFETTTSSAELIAVTAIGGYSTSSIILYSIIFICILAIIVVPTLVFHACKKKKKEEEDRRKLNGEKSTLLENGHNSLIHPIMEPETIEMIVTPKEKELPISDLRMISKGRFGEVYRATWTNENGETRFVAVKKMPESQKKCYEAEKQIFETFKSYPKWYSCVVGFTCAEKIGNEYLIVTDFHERLSLFELLKHNTISIASCGRLLVSMLDGLQFLHDDRSFFEDYSKKPVIHRDIKSKNILVRNDMTACIADFGLARIYDNDHVKCDILAQVGTRRYMSPEMMEGAVDLSPTGFKAMDVYSMALVMWETISRTKLNDEDKVPEHQVPYHEVGFDPKVNVMRQHITVEKNRPKWRPEIMESEHTKAFARTTEEMWEHEASARITAGCGLERIWKVFLINPPPPPSEGYFTESSEESSIPMKPVDRYIGLNMVDTSKLRIYHTQDTEHPTPDPTNYTPPLPPIPMIVEEGIIHNADAEPIEKEEEEGFAEERVEEDVYDIELGRFLSKQEKHIQSLMRDQQQQQQEECNTRASTPTPSQTFY